MQREEEHVQEQQQQQESALTEEPVYYGSMGYAVKTEYVKAWAAFQEQRRAAQSRTVRRGNLRPEPSRG